MLKRLFVSAGIPFFVLSLSVKAQEQGHVITTDSTARKEVITVDGVELNERQLKRYYRQLRKDSIRAHKNIWWSVLHSVLEVQS